MQQAHARHYESGLRHYEISGVIATASPPKTQKKKTKQKNLATKTQPTRTHSNWEPNPFVRPSICLFVCLFDRSIDRSIVCLFVVIFFYDQKFTGRPGGWVGEWAKGLLTLTS